MHSETASKWEQVSGFHSMETAPHSLGAHTIISDITGPQVRENPLWRAIYILMGISTQLKGAHILKFRIRAVIVRKRI